MKKMMSILMILCMIMTSNVIVFAEEQYVTIEEYEAAICEEAERYDIVCNIIDYDPEIKITKEMLQKGIDNVREYAKSVHTTNECYVSKEIDVVDSINPYLMPVTRNVYGYFQIKNVYGNARMCVEANVTIDLQANNVMYVNSIESYQLGAFVNFTSWSESSITYKMNSPSAGSINVVVKGRATFSYADPVTGITTGYTSSVSEVVTIDCN